VRRICSLSGRALGAAAVLLGVGVTLAAAHAFPERAEPRVGGVVRTAPSDIRIWFDGDLEPAFSRVTVASAGGQRVDRGDAGVDPANRRLLRVGLAPLSPGVYKVTWSVLAVDGHRTEGDYTFTFKPPS
jgi:methionine-rich copper-binding protein CopC